MAKKIGKTPKEQETLAKMVIKWNRLIDAKKRSKADKLFDEIMRRKGENFRPF